jgi:hypothetical protein
MNFDKHGESLVQYCYAISKVAFALNVVGPAVSQTGSFVDMTVGLFVTVAFLVFAMVLERGVSS